MLRGQNTEEVINIIQSNQNHEKSLCTQMLQGQNTEEVINIIQSNQNHEKSLCTQMLRGQNTEEVINIIQSNQNHEKSLCTQMLRGQNTEEVINIIQSNQNHEKSLCTQMLRGQNTEEVINIIQSNQNHEKSLCTQMLRGQNTEEVINIDESKWGRKNCLRTTPGIPLEKLEEGPIRKFFEKYCAFKLPSVTTLRRVVPKLSEKIAAIRSDIGDSNIWLTVDEATDPLGRYIANVVVEPVITRWGTWLTAAAYYFEHFEKLQQVIEELEEDAASIATAKELMQDPKLMPQLIFIASNFKHISKTIEQLQRHTIPLTSAFSKMEQISQCNFPGPTGEKVKNKVRAVLERNCGWNELKNIALSRGRQK
ncbi:hypothetical protein WDU94_010756 [Cyamophila willieti]